MWGARPKVVRRHRPDRSRRWCRLKRPRARAAGQAAVDEQADAEADAATAEQEAANPAELQIVDSGWFAADNGMVDFAVKVQNPNKTVEAIDPVIEVVGKDDSGNVIFDETIETPGVLPDSTYYYSYVAGSTADSSANSTEVVKPATVEFSITTPEGSWEATDQKLAHVYAVQDGGATDTQFGAKEFTGTVTASSRWMAPRSRASTWCCLIKTGRLRAVTSRLSTPSLVRRPTTTSTPWALLSTRAMPCTPARGPRRTPA